MDAVEKSVTCPLRLTVGCGYSSSRCAAEAFDEDEDEAEGLRPQPTAGPLLVPAPAPAPVPGRESGAALLPQCATIGGAAFEVDVFELDVAAAAAESGAHSSELAKPFSAIKFQFCGFT